jgi:putative transposase
MSVSEHSFKKGFKYPIYPTEDQKILLEKTFGCCRYVYNKGLAEAIKAYEDYKLATKCNFKVNKPKVSGYDFVNKLIVYKHDPETPWLKEVNSVALQQSMIHLGSAFTKFFKTKKGYPKFKSKSNRQSFTLMKTSFRFKEKKLYIAKSDDLLKIGYSRKLPSEPSSAVISKTPTGKYYISFVCEYFPTKTNGQGKIGIDLGIKDFLVTNNGLKVPNPKNYNKCQHQLKRRQQSLSRKKKGSKNRNKARIVVAKQHERIANLRNDFLHKLSRKLVNENQVIGVETLKVANMVRNRKLAKSISDVAWSSFTTMLKYKAIESQNCTLVFMDSFFPSSHICSVDGEKLTRKLSLKERSWTCPVCNTLHDRDINAAKVIRDEAILTIALSKIPENKGTLVLANAKH